MTPESAPKTETPELELCEKCQKPLAMCVCAGVVPIDNRIELLVLQHPQEQDRLLGTARMAVQHFKRASFKIGLSWPSLEKLLGRTADPQRWAVLFLGAEGTEQAPGREISLLDGKGHLLPDQDKALSRLEGIILLDGSWSQAKTLWWRNPWVLKTRRLVLQPETPSLYGKLRREPRREGLSTIEAAGMALSRLEKRPEIETMLKSTFANMLARYRVSGLAPPRPDRRKRWNPRAPRKAASAKPKS